MLISFSGLPATGKSTVARLLAERLRATWLRIDSLEQALARAGVRIVDDAGYRAAMALAEDNLRIGRVVVSDCVNPFAVTRDAWRDVAVRCGLPCLEVEIVCSDPGEHRRRVEGRAVDIEGMTLPDWRAVAEREYHPWTREVLVLDTAKLPAEEAAEQIRARAWRMGVEFRLIQ